MGSPRPKRRHTRSSPNSRRYLEERESSTMSTGMGPTSPKQRRVRNWMEDSSSLGSSTTPTTALHDQFARSETSHHGSSSAPFRLSKRPSFLSRLSSGGSRSRKQKSDEKDGNLEREAVPNDSDAEATVCSPSSVKSNGSSRRRRSSMKFLKRALSAPLPLQRLQSHSRHKKRQDIIGSCSSSSSNYSVTLNPNSELMEKISVVPQSVSPQSKKREIEPPKESSQSRISCNATSILHHSFLMESICGLPPKEDHDPDTSFVFEESNRILLNGKSFHNETLPSENRSERPISEDPTIQESIECIFASQLEDGLKLWDEEDDPSSTHSNGQNATGAATLMSPTDLQQSRMNRKDRKNSGTSLYANMSQNKKRYEQASLVYIGTFDPRTPSPPNSPLRRKSSAGTYNTLCPADVFDTSTIFEAIDPLPCNCATSFLPSMKPKDWPQAPVALRPTPGSGTRVKAIRKSNSSEPLWVPGSHLTWSQQLAKTWGRPYQQQAHFACCEHCVLLPVNNGNEPEGESLVVDFESELFEGSILVRLRYSNGTTQDPYDDSVGYFSGVNRRYQVCITGRFKSTIPFTELTTGFRLQRKFGKLPSKWVLKSALRVVSFFAPQLDIRLEGVDEPYSIAPLGSTPQAIIVNDLEEDDASKILGRQYFQMEERKTEPKEAHKTLLGFKGDENATTPLQRAKIRKKAFDKLYAQQSKDPLTDPSKIYTFEFLQHMVNFQDLSIELGSVLGSLELEDMLDGQPLQIMAAHHKTPLWSFDVWNERLWEKAKEHDATRRQHNTMPQGCL